MDWKDFEKEMFVLSQKIDGEFYAIVAVVRGGLVPARMLAKYLNVKNMYGLTVRKVGEDRKVVSEILDDLHDKNILLIEDVLESGKSLIVAKKYLEAKGANVKTVCLYTMPQTEIVPDFYLKPISELITFPWD